MKKVLKIGIKVLKVSLACIIVLFTCVILLQRFSNSSFSVAGYRIFAVVTGSMEPEYSVGDVLLCKKIDTNELKEGDDVTYLGKEGTFKDKVVTHRIKKIIEKDGKRTFITKGIANKSADPPVEPSQIYGKVAKKLVVLSFLHGYSSSAIGFFLFVILPIMALVGSEIVQTMLERKTKQVLAPQGAGVQGTNQTVPVQSNSVQNGVTAEQLQQQLANLQQQLQTQQQGQQQNVNAQAQVNPQGNVQGVNQTTNQQVNNVQAGQVVNQQNVEQQVQSNDNQNNAV